MKKSIIAISFSALFLATLPLGALADSAAVNCDTAQADIAHLQHEKKSTDERAVKGVLSVMPIGLVINAVASAADSDSPEEMEIKEYNEKISQRIDEIKKTCGIE
jgi:hypothetical protein